jgi:predicted MFS family arabinose efflux permease
MTIYMVASPLPALVSFVLGGWLNTLYGWRMTFFIMGIPGLLIAVLVKLTIAEPRLDRRHSYESSRPLPRVLDVLTTLWHQRSLRHLGIGIVVLFTLMWGLWPWYAAFMVRSHGMSIVQLGIWLGLISGGGGIAGILLGGFIADRCFPNDERSQMRVNAVVIASLTLWFTLFLLLPQKHYALIALVPLVVVFNFWFGPTFALMQRLVADEMRATALALVMLVGNLVGMGIGPQIVGLLSDLLNPSLGNDALRYAMLIMSFLALWVSYHFWRASASLSDDLEAVQRKRHTKY